MFAKFQSYKNAQFEQNVNSKPLKMTKIMLFEILNSQKSISRKFQVAENSLDLHTVQN